MVGGCAITGVVIVKVPRGGYSVSLFAEKMTGNARRVTGRAIGNDWLRVLGPTTRFAYKIAGAGDRHSNMGAAGRGIVSHSAASYQRRSFEI